MLLLLYGDTSLVSFSDSLLPEALWLADPPLLRVARGTLSDSLLPEALSCLDFADDLDLTEPADLMDA